ncbi:MAG TPA: TIGR03016 family PEP-CTERM system-associated outer membrane protein [Gammaproteobacteria bacterium]
MDMGRSKAASHADLVVRLARQITHASSGVLLLGGLCSGTAVARDWVFTPRLSVSEIYTDNAELEPSGQEDSDLITVITPGFTLQREAARLKLKVDYQAQSLIYVEDDDANRVNHGLNGTMNAELREDLVFLDASARMSQAIVDARAPQSLDGIGGGRNLTDVQAYSISPYLLHNFSNYFNGTLRVGHERVYTDNTIQTSESNFVTGALNSGVNFGLLDWSLNYLKRREDRGSRDRLDRESIDANVAYRLHPKLSLVAEGGREDNDYGSTRIAQNGSYWAAGATWTPNRYLSLTALEGDRYKSGTVRLTPGQRTSLLVSYRERQVGLNPGSVWSGSFRHRTRRTVWQLNYFEDTQTTQRALIDSLALQDAAQDAFNAGDFFLDADGNIILNVDPFDFFSLREEVFERKRGQASASYRTGKSIFALSAFTEERDFLESNVIGDVADAEKSRGATAHWRWQFSGLSHTNVRGGWRRTEFSSDGREDDRWYVDTLLARTLSRNATGSVGYRFTRNDSTQGSAEYTENRIIVRLDIEF